MSALDKIINRIIENRVILHLLYWLAVLVFYCIYGLGHGQPLLVSLVLKMTIFPIQIIATYTFIYWQLPLIFKKRYLLFALNFVVLSYLFYLLVHVNYDMGIGTLLISWHQPHPFVEMLTDGEFYFNYVVNIYLVVFVTATIKFIKDHLESRQLIYELESETSRVQYNIIQAKIQPSLILRSLKLIKSKSLERSDDASVIIESLSQVLDDALYGSRLMTRGLEEEALKLSTYVQLYAKGSSTIKEARVTTKFTNDNLLIRTLVLNNIVEEIFNQIETHTYNDLAIDIIILNEEENCIFQITSDQDIAINLKKITDILDITYKDRYSISEFTEGGVKDVQVIVDLSDRLIN